MDCTLIEYDTVNAVKFVCVASAIHRPSKEGSDNYNINEKNNHESDYWCWWIYIFFSSHIEMLTCLSKET